MNRRFVRTVPALLAVLGVAWYLHRQGAPETGVAPSSAPFQSLGAPAAEPSGGSDAARAAFEQRASGRMLRVRGRVLRLLADDRDGSPHQRFIIGTDSGQSLLVAHNLDLAPRLDALAVGDRVSVYGEYEWNDRGGLMHWTHDDPAGRHEAGYIEWQGRRYQ